MTATEIHQNNRNTVAKYFHRCLFSDEGRKALDYIYSRSISDQTIKDFQLGFCPADYRGEFRLQQRLIAPLFDPYGNVVAFAGRLITYKNNENIFDAYTKELVIQYDHSMGKNIALKKTWWHEPFSKRFYLYGLNVTKEKIRNSDRKNKNYVVVVEGEFDIWGLYSQGITNVVATLGTAMTDFHISQLLRYADQIILLFDSDQAGLTAQSKALDRMAISDECAEVVLDHLRFPDGTIIKPDPHDYINIMGKDALMQKIYNARKSIGASNLHRTDLDEQKLMKNLLAQT